MAGRRVRRLNDDHGKAVRIPREFELPRDETLVRRAGDRPKIELVPTQLLVAMLTRLQPLDDEIPEIDDPAPKPVEV